MHHHTAEAVDELEQEIELVTQWIETISAKKRAQVIRTILGWRLAEELSATSAIQEEDVREAIRMLIDLRNT